MALGGVWVGYWALDVSDTADSGVFCEYPGPSDVVNSGLRPGRSRDGSRILFIVRCNAPSDDLSVGRFDVC